MINSNLRNLINGLHLTPEQYNLINFIITNKFNGLIEPTEVNLLYYSGQISGSEFLSYNVNKIYICFSLLITNSVDTLATDCVPVELYNENNISVFTLKNNSLALTSVENAFNALFNFSNAEIRNIYFSRLNNVNSDYYGMIFNGIRLIY